MSITQQIAKHFREVYFGGNWTSVNYKDLLEDVTWQEAVVQTDGCNSIAVLVYHTGYYIHAVSKVLEGGALEAKDSLSFNAPAIQSEQDWQQLLDTTFVAAAAFAELVEALPDEKMQEYFTNEKYGSYYRNLHGIIEHLHYHLGQIAVLKKLIRNRNATTSQ